MRTTEEITSWNTRLAALNVSARREVEQLKAQALAYVWGFQDAGEVCDTDESMRFADAYGLHALDYAEGKRSCRHNLRDSYESWRKSGIIER